MTGRARAEAALTEADLQRRVLDTARTLGRDDLSGTGQSPHHGLGNR